jgi:hypothetical protein
VQADAGETNPAPGARDQAGSPRKWRA